MLNSDVIWRTVPLADVDDISLFALFVWNIIQFALPLDSAGMLSPPALSLSLSLSLCADLIGNFHRLSTALDIANVETKTSSV